CATWLPHDGWRSARAALPQATDRVAAGASGDGQSGMAEVAGVPVAMHVQATLATRLPPILIHASLPDAGEEAVATPTASLAARTPVSPDMVSSGVVSSGAMSPELVPSGLTSPAMSSSMTSPAAISSPMPSSMLSPGPMSPSLASIAAAPARSARHMVAAEGVGTYIHELLDGRNEFLTRWNT